jgi:7-cyano-7-deazaguanine reductase
VPEPALETIENRYAGRDYRIELTALEFTSLCPLTGAPDVGTVTVRYIPAERLVEMKSLRDYLAGFRNRQIFVEEVVNEVLDDFVSALAPRWAEVEGDFNARGAMRNRVVARSGPEPGP